MIDGVISTKLKNTCPDCATRVETYIKSVNEFQEHIDKLLANLKDVVKTIGAIEERYSEALHINQNASELAKGCTVGTMTILRKALTRIRANLPEVDD